MYLHGQKRFSVVQFHRRRHLPGKIRRAVSGSDALLENTRGGIIVRIARLHIRRPSVSVVQRHEHTRTARTFFRIEAIFSDIRRDMAEIQFYTAV